MRAILVFIIIVVVAIILTVLLFGAVNPMIDTKNGYAATMKKNGCTRIPNAIIYNSSIDLATLHYPVIMKPNVKTGCGYGVEKINDPAGAKKYIDNFDPTCNDSIIIQEVVNAANEIGVLCERTTDDTFKIISTIMKKPVSDSVPFDQRSTCSDVLICSSVDLSTEATNNILADVSTIGPDINVVKLDIMYNTPGDLSAGKYSIIEINGVFGYTDYIGKKFSLGHLQYSARWVAARLKFGASNLLCGNVDINSMFNLWLLPRVVMIADIDLSSL